MFFIGISPIPINKRKAWTDFATPITGGRRIT